MRFIPAWRWNQKFVEPVAECIALSGTNTRILRSSYGQSIELTRDALWHHPWYTEPSWNARDERWEAHITAGFVAGMDPIVPGAEDADLVDDPVIPIHAFRSIPGEGDPIPPFFAALGVQEPDSGLEISEVGGVTVDQTPRDTDPLPPRALRAVDFYVAVARATYRPVVTVTDASGTSGQVVDYSVVYDTTTLDRTGSRARLMQASLMPKVKTPTFLDRLNGTYEDEGEDRQLISTVYLLSPPNQLEGEPDETWTPYVKHAAFWNFAYHPRNLMPEVNKPLRFPGTGLPLADMIVGQWLALQNSLYQQILNAFDTTSNAGKFHSI